MRTLPHLLLGIILFLAAHPSKAALLSVASPDGRTVVEVKTDGALCYAVMREGGFVVGLEQDKSFFPW